MWKDIHSRCKPAEASSPPWGENMYCPILCPLWPSLIKTFQMKSHEMVQHVQHVHECISMAGGIPIFRTLALCGKIFTPDANLQKHIVTTVWKNMRS